MNFRKFSLWNDVPSTMLRNFVRQFCTLRSWNNICLSSDSCKTIFTMDHEPRWNWYSCLMQRNELGKLVAWQQTRIFGRTLTDIVIENHGPCLKIRPQILQPELSGDNLDLKFEFRAGFHLLWLVAVLSVFLTDISTLRKYMHGTTPLQYDSNWPLMRAIACHLMEIHIFLRKRFTKYQQINIIN